MVKLFRFLFFVTLSSLFLFYYQNCAKYSFSPVTSEQSLTQTLASASSAPPATTIPSQPQIIENTGSSKMLLITPEESAAPIKIIFVVDDSQTMTLNQQNLQSGIDAMLQNIADVDTEIHILTTTQGKGLTLANDPTVYTNNSGEVVIASDANLMTMPVGTQIFSSNSYTTYIGAPLIKISHLDSPATKASKITALKSKLLVGTNGSNNEIGIQNLLNAFYSPKFSNTARSKTSINDGDAALIILISDENEIFSSSNLLSTFKNTQTVTHRGGDYTYQLSTKQRTVNFVYTEPTTGPDGIINPFGEISKQIPNSQIDWDTSIQPSCPQALVNQLTTQYKNADPSFKSFKSCVAQETMSSYPITNMTSGSMTLSDLCSIAQKNLDNGYIKITKCDFLNPNTPPYYSPQTASLSPSISSDKIFSLEDYFKTLFADKDNINLYTKSFVDILKNKFGNNGYFFTAIVNDGTCSMSADQSVGSVFMKINSMIPSNSSIIPICSPNKYSSALKSASTIVKKSILSKFTLTDKFKSIESVTVVGSTYRKSLKLGADYTTNNNAIEIIDKDLLKAGDKIEVKLAL